MLPESIDPRNAAGPPPARPGPKPGPREYWDKLNAARAAAEQHPAFRAAERIKNGLAEAADSCRGFAETYGPDAIPAFLAARGLVGPGMLPAEFAPLHAAIGAIAWLLDLLDDSICLENALPETDGTVPPPADLPDGRAA